MLKTFKQWFIENANHEHLQNLLNSLNSLGFKKQESGNFSLKTSYGKIDILGDHLNQNSFNSFAPYKNSEFWRIVVSMPFDRLDEVSKQAINKIIFLKNDSAEIKKIRDQFIPRWEINSNLGHYNGPEIVLKNNRLTFLYFTRGYSASQIFFLIDKLIEDHPKYYPTTDDDDNDDNENPFDNTPKPSGSLLNV